MRLFRGVGLLSGSLQRRSEEAQIQRADFGLKCLVSLRLPRLPAQIARLPFEFPEDVLGAQKVLLGLPQAQFRLVAASMKAGRTGGILENTAAMLRLRADDLADLPLPHQGGRTCARRSIREKDLHVTRPHFPPVDAESRALFPHDPPRDLQRLSPVEMTREILRRLREPNGNLSVVTAGAGARAGEDHVIHLAAAQGFRRGFPHRPAQGFHEIGFSTAIGADNAREARRNEELRRIDEGLEPMKAQPLELHPEPLQPEPRPAAFRSGGLPCSGNKARRTLFREQRLKQLVHLRDGTRAAHPLAIDEESGSGIDAKLLRAVLLHRIHAVIDRLVFQAGLEAFL
jgi:hypothetical protein